MPQTLAELAQRLAEIAQRVAELQTAQSAVLAAAPYDAEPQADALREETIRTLREDAEDIADMLAAPGRLPSAATVFRISAAAPEGLAVVIGHTQKSPGAQALSPPFPADDPSTQIPEDHEYGWNTDLAKRISKLAQDRDIRCQIFTRDQGGIAGAYRRVAAFNPVATVELHFNSAERPARGSETLYASVASEKWASTLQQRLAKLYNRHKSDKTDRGIKLVKSGDRGFQSVSQRHPSALIEPFFCHVFDDAKLGNDLKPRLAEEILFAYAEFVGMGLSPGSPRPERPLSVPCGERLDISDRPLFNRLRETYRDIDIEFPSLKSITLAQWALESGWGQSELAVKHLNFGGLKAKSEVKRILDEVPAEKVFYIANDGGDDYLRFPSLAGFIKGYWMFLDRSPYRGFRDHARRSPEDFIRFIGRIYTPTAGYADKVIEIKNRLEAASEGLCPGVPDGGKIDTGSVPANAALFRTLIERFDDLSVPALVARKAALLSQCALESNWGRSELATSHMNFAGIEWHDRLSDLAARAPHPTPGRGDYCRFLGIAQFLSGYGARFQRDPALADWQSAADSDESLMRFLSENWRPDDRSYFDKLKDLHRRLAGDSGPSLFPISSPEIDIDGYVVRVQRTGEERRDGKVRTVGQYQAFLNRRKLDGIAGTMLETRGPGDNTRTGIRKRRIEQGLYPLATHSGTKYATFGFSQSNDIRDLKRPAIAVRQTGVRTAVLIHPGIGFLSSVGCLNPTQALSGASGDMAFPESRKRALALFDSMREHLGGDFPSHNLMPIKNGWLLIEGEPKSPALSLAGLSAASLPGADELFDLVADALGAELDAEGAESALKRIAELGVDLKTLRDPWQMNLWTPWAEGIESSFAIPDLERRARELDVLGKIAGRLDAAGVDINDSSGVYSPIVAAAINDDVNAVAALRERGADAERHDNTGLNALLAAAYYGAAHCFSFLFFNGADATARSRTPTLASGLEEALTEICESGSTVKQCAEQGRAMAVGDQRRLSDYESILTILFDADNPMPDGSVQQ